MALPKKVFLMRLNFHNFGKAFCKLTLKIGAISMRIFTALIILFVSCFFAQTVSAQLDTFLQPFKAKAGVPMAMKSADSSMTSAKLLGVLTLGDTTSSMDIPPGVTFNMANGYSKIWIYFLAGQSRHTNADTAQAVAVVNALLFGFQVLPFDASALGQFSAFATALPDNWLDSDEMAAKISANAEYKLFSAKYPDKKPLLVPLSVAVASRFFPMGTPLWQLNFGGAKPGSSNPGGPMLACEVHAATGETKCEEIILSAEESVEMGDNFAIMPNPTTESVRFSVPSTMRGYEVSVSVINTLGHVIFSHNVETSHAETIVLPVEQLPSGAYYLICSVNGKSVRAMFAMVK